MYTCTPVHPNQSLYHCYLFIINSCNQVKNQIMILILILLKLEGNIERIDISPTFLPLDFILSHKLSLDASL